ncbi:MAG: VanZ family protein [Clostridia bacterium]|nr:VanZ family protein [Clostridia bacterium]
MRFKRIVLLILIIIWAVTVYYFSGQEGETSSNFSRRVVEFFIHNEKWVDIIEPYARKVAHFSEYGIGGCLFLLLFRTYKWGDIKVLSLSGVFGCWYAVVDEYHQTLVQGRYGSPLDVVIDTLGCLTWACFLLIFIKIIEMHKEKKKQEKFEKFKRRVRPGT